MTGKSHEQVLEEWGLLSPLAALRRQLNHELPEDSLTPDVFKRGPGGHAWQRVMDTLLDPPTSSLVEVPNQPNDGVPCPECGVYFANRASMLCHMSKRHKHHEARPVNQADRPFDKHTDAKGGLPQCSHCHAKLCDFSSPRKHINERRCKVLFPAHPQSQAPSTHPGPPKVSNPAQTENLRLPPTAITHPTP